MKSRKSSWAQPDPASSDSGGKPYIGRFAPSPTGPLHAGSLVAALASYLDARANDGLWYVRMEDLDPPRESPEAADAILRALEALGLTWDGEVVYQSRRHAAYRAALDHLSASGLAFPCDCTRKEIRDAGGIYPGTCRGKSSLTGRHAIRCRVPDCSQAFLDLLQGPCCQHLRREVGDFVIRRKDGLYAYQLAVVVDDAWQGISHIIRGVDLLDSTPRQIWLQRCLGLSTPRHGHLPVVVNADGQKLSKQHHATPVDIRRPQSLLLQTLTYLRQDPDPALGGCDAEDILRWAVANWRPQRLHGLHQMAEFVPARHPAL